MKKFHLLFFVTLMITTLASCLPAAEPAPATAQNTPLSLPIDTPTPVQATPAPPEIQETPTDTASRLDTNCLEIMPALPDNAELTGQVVLEGELVVRKGLTGAPSKLDVATMILMPIQAPENTIQGGYQVSPNHRQVASWKSYFDANGKETSVSVVIENNAGIKLAEVPGDMETWDTFYWLDNEHLVIGDYGQPYVLNPFTGEDLTFYEWHAKSPGGWRIVPIWETNGVFDSQLSRILYMQEDKTMLLWDLKSEQVLFSTSLKGRYLPGGRPKWAWDDSQVVIGYTAIDGVELSDELFSISRGGKITQLTELGKDYQEVGISEFNWSPDGEKIAFFFKDFSQRDNPWQLAIVDVETREVINYCGLAGWMRPPVEPVWSPDGKQLLVGRAEADQETFSTILVDISGNYAARLADHLVPAGWMIKEP